jgi:oxygen-dependent protoporphyrinogen oxidase
MNATRVAVVGAGISGLTAAFRLGRRFAAAGRPLALTVLEADAHAGGHAHTRGEDGFQVEAGPNGFLDRVLEPYTRELARDLGIEGELVESRPEAKRRFILLGGRLRIVPEGPPSMIATDVLTPAGKLRLMLEPFARKRPEGVDETVFEFAVRRIGREAAERLVDTAISGISAGDSRALSVADAFPLMTEMERDHGSLIRAMIARAKLGPTRLMAFRGGMSSLVAALRERIDGTVRTSARVTRLERAGEAWRLGLADGTSLDADLVVMAQHAWDAAPLLAPHDATLAERMAAFPRAGLALVAMAFRAADSPRPLAGYGYLVARAEGLETLGVVWESSLFEGRAPQGMILLRCMVGGARHPRVAGLSEPEILDLARREMTPVMGIHAEPVRTWIRPFPDAIAQYTVGHAARVADARARVARLPALELTGTSYDGVSFNSAVHSGALLADRVFARVASDPRAVLEGTPA